MIFLPHYMWAENTKYVQTYQQNGGTMSVENIILNYQVIVNSLRIAGKLYSNLFLLNLKE